MSPVKSAARAVAFSPDGKYLVGGGGDDTFERNLAWLVMWDVANWQEVGRLEGHRELVTCLEFHPQGQILASGSRDKTVRLWDVDERKPLHVLKAIEMPGPASEVSGIAFSADGAHLATCGTDSYLKIWRSDTAALERELFGSPAGVQCVAFDDEGRVWGGGSDGGVRAWALSSGEIVQTLRGHERPVAKIIIDAPGHLIAGGNDGSLRRWEMESGKSLRTMRAHNDGVRALVMEPSGWRVLSGGSDGFAYWDLRRELDTVQRPVTLGNMMTRVAFLPGGQCVIYPDQLGFSVWNLNTGETKTFAGKHKLPIAAMAVSSNGKLVATASHGDGVVVVCETATGEVLHTLDADTMLAQGLAFSPDSEWLATCGMDNQRLQMWNLRDETKNFGLAQVSGGHYSTLAFHPDGKALVAGSVQEQIQVFDLKQKKILWDIPGQITTLRISFAEKGRVMVNAGADGRVRVWDWKKRELLHDFSASGRGFHLSLGAAYAEQGPRLFVGAGEELRLFDLNSKLEVATFPGNGTILDLAVSPDGQRVATISTNFVDVLDARSLSPQQLLEREGYSLALHLMQTPVSKEQMQQELHDGKWPLSDAARDRALQVIAASDDTGARFNAAAWNIARQAGRPREEYERARQFAEHALQRTPNDGSFLNTLGVLEYRLGSFSAAAETLARSKRKNVQQLGLLSLRFEPTDVAFLAMSLHKLGRAKEAQENLESARISMRFPLWKAQRELRGFLEEAEQALQEQVERAPVP